MTALLDVRDVSVTLGGRQVLRRLSFGPLQAGTVTALIGSNAAGKSTLLRRIAGELDGPGAVTVAGRPLLDWPVLHPNRPAHVPQDISMNSSLRVMEAVLLSAKQNGAWTVQEEELDAVTAILQTLHLQTLADRELASLSGGQRQLVSIAQALIRHPRILLLDEPTSALDLKRQFEVLSLIRRLAKARQLCALIAIHDINHALRFADQVVVLHEGAVQAFGPPQRVVTPALLAQVYGVAARVEPCSYGYAQIIVDQSLSAEKGEDDADHLDA